jgi:nucleotide-binding universal stress UspA family protein
MPQHYAGLIANVTLPGHIPPVMGPDLLQRRTVESTLAAVEEVAVSAFHRILVGWDGSTDSRRALRAALQLSGPLGAEVVVLAVLKRHPHAEAMDEAEEEVAARCDELASEIEAAAKDSGIACSNGVRSETVVADDPASALGRYAAEHGFDLLVVGRHGIDRALHPRVGGVTEHQVRYSPCPVLVVSSR